MFEDFYEDIKLKALYEANANEDSKISDNEILIWFRKIIFILLGGGIFVVYRQHSQNKKRNIQFSLDKTNQRNLASKNYSVENKDLEN